MPLVNLGKIPGLIKWYHDDRQAASCRHKHDISNKARTHPRSTGGGFALDLSGTSAEIKMRKNAARFGGTGKRCVVDAA